MGSLTGWYLKHIYISLICFRYQLDDGPMWVETCSWLNLYFIKLCFDGLSVYFLFILQQNAMDNFKIEILTLCIYKYSFIHSVFCLTTDPKPPPKRPLHIVQSRASSFKWEHPLLSLRSSNNFLRLLPLLPVTSFPRFYLSFNNPLYKAVSTQNVTNPVSLPFTYFV